MFESMPWVDVDRRSSMEMFRMALMGPSACADQGMSLTRCTLERFRRWRSSTRGKGTNVSWEKAACSQRRSS